METIINALKATGKWLWKNMLLIFILSLACFILSFLFLTPLIQWVNIGGIGYEMRFYIRFFLLLTLINTFAVLRLYNSILANTRFLLKVREAVVTFGRALPNLERKIQSSVNTTNQLKETLKENNSLLREKKKENEKKSL